MLYSFLDRPQDVRERAIVLVLHDIMQDVSGGRSWSDAFWAHSRDLRRGLEVLDTDHSLRQFLERLLEVRK